MELLNKKEQELGRKKTMYWYLDSRTKWILLIINLDSELPGSQSKKGKMLQFFIFC